MEEMEMEHIGWVIQAKDGDMAGFSGLYSLYCDKIYTLVCSMVENEKDAEDIVQETFIRAWRGIGALVNPEAFSTWIQRIAHNRCCTYQQKRYKKILAEVALEAEEGLLSELEAEEESIPSVYVERDDLKLRLNEMINHLGDPKRQTFTLFYVNNMKVEEIAQIMECSVNTVRSRLRLGRKAIRLAIEEWEAESGEEFYHGAGIPLLPFGEAMAQVMQRKVLSRAASESILNNILTGISQPPANNGPQARGSNEPGQPKKLPKRPAASSGFTLQAKLIAGFLAVIAAGTVVYVVADQTRNRSVPVAAVAPWVAEAPAVLPEDESPTQPNTPEQTDITAPTNTPPQTDAFIVWEDPAFEAAVRASMRISEAPIAVSVAAAEKRLQLNLPKAVSLGDLQYFPNLESLELQGEGTLELSPLAGLTKLEELHIIGVQASDWTRLTELAALKWLSLENTHLSNPTWLAKLTRLELLHFANVNTFDLSILCELTTLESLQITDSSLADVTPLSCMKSLSWISVKNTNVSDLSPLSSLPKLKWLDISGTKVTDISSITGWPNPPHVVADGF